MYYSYSPISNLDVLMSLVTESMVSIVVNSDWGCSLRTIRLVGCSFEYLAFLV